MVYKERTTQNPGRVARAFRGFTNTHFHAFSNEHETEEANLLNSTEVERGFSLNEELNTEYLQYKGQLLINRTIIK